MTTVFFFDSHGGLWATCSADDHRAVSFGPAGAARQATVEEAGIRLRGSTAYSAAMAERRVVSGEDWDTLMSLEERWSLDRDEEDDEFFASR
jgi:hypothetical protein